MMKLGWKDGEILYALQKVYKDNAPQKLAVYKMGKFFDYGARRCGR